MKSNQTMKMKTKKTFIRNEAGNIDMITMGITAAIMFAIAIPIIFSTLGSLNITTTDTTLRTAMGEAAGFKPAANATSNLITQTNSFFSIGPIYLVVIVAVGIIGALLYLRQKT